MKFKITFRILRIVEEEWREYELKRFCSVKAGEKFLSKEKYYPNYTLKEEMERSLKQNSGLVFRVEEA